MATKAGLKKVRVSAMNAVHDLAVLVARDEGLFQKEGLDLEILDTPGTSQADADRQALKSDIFDHILTVLPYFGLKMFQSPSGNDFQLLKQDK